jgi:hypothetical protein
VAGSTPGRAVRAFVTPIQAALSCFATGKVTVDQYRAGPEGVLALNRGASVRLNGPARIELSITMRYLIRQTDDEARGPWKVTTTGWIYGLYSHSGDPLAEYHWHPISSSHVTTPHLHVPMAQRCHFPTGRVLIEDVLTLATEHGAQPIDPRRWARREAANRAAFLRGATWGQTSRITPAGPG